MVTGIRINTLINEKLHDKWNFLLRISSGNVTKRIWSYLLKKLLMEDFIFLCSENGTK